MAGIGFGTNYDVKGNANGLGGKTRILSLSMTDMTQAKLDAVCQALQAGGTAGTDDAVTIAGVSAFVAGTTDVVYVAVQGTGALTAADDYRGVTDVDMAIVATFDDEGTNGGATA